MNIKSLFAAASAICVLSACSKSNSIKEDDLTGVWVARRALYYLKGEERTFLPNANDDSGLLGSINNPKVLKFTKYKEVLIGTIRKNSAGEEMNLYEYTISNDSIKFNPKLPARNIYKKGNDTLVTVHSLRSKFTDKYVGGKVLLTVFYTR